MTSIFEGTQPPKQGLFQSKQGSFVVLCICSCRCCFLVSCLLFVLLVVTPITSLIIVQTALRFDLWPGSRHRRRRPSQRISSIRRRWCEQHSYPAGPSGDDSPPLDIGSIGLVNLHTQKFNSSPWKNDDWKTSLSFWDGTFFWGANC